MKKITLIAVLLIIFVSACSSKENEDMEKARKLIDYNKKKFDSLPLSGKVLNGVREIELKALQYRWEPENIVVNKGDRIRLSVTSEDVPHGFELEGITIPGWMPDNLIKKGDKVTFELTADEAGVWDIVCTGYCGPGHGGMKGKYIVREDKK